VTTSPRRWIERARALQRDRHTRESEGACFVEGIRQVLSAIEAGHPLEAVLVDPARLKSQIAWEAVERARVAGAEVVTLQSGDFERISSRDNPVGVAAIVRWQALPLERLITRRDGLYLVADDVRDPGNLGTLARTLDGAGGHALIAHAGTDPGHPGALRSSLGASFHVPTYAAATLDAVFAWSEGHGVTTLATSANAGGDLWEVPLVLPLAVLVGNEGEGLGPETIARAGQRVSIPMLGTATSLNVSVAAGIILYEVRRQSRPAIRTPVPDP
jgi:TrmH family RNA methyltransferase